MHYIYPKAVSTPKKVETALTEIHQIELSTFCNLKCEYCPSPNFPRERKFMDMETFDRALEWVEHFVAQGTQMELALTGIGESLMHPQFIEMVAKARAVLGDILLIISTNGILLNEKMCEALAPYEPRVFISMHHKEKAKNAIRNAKLHGIFQELNQSHETSSFNWAGQVNWPVSAPKIECDYLSKGWGVVLVEGDISTCCLDATGAGIVGHVNDEVGSSYVKPYSLCYNCHMEIT